MAFVVILARNQFAHHLGDRPNAHQSVEIAHILLVPASYWNTIFRPGYRSEAPADFDLNPQ